MSDESDIILTDSTDEFCSRFNVVSGNTFRTQKKWAEGEFEKRINLVAIPPTSASHRFTPELRKLKMSEALEIVAEAKKEFPEWGTKYHNDLAVYINDVHAWFVKWFGDGFAHTQPERRC